MKFQAIRIIQKTATFIRQRNSRSVIVCLLQILKITKAEATTGQKSVKKKKTKAPTSKPSVKHTVDGRVTPPLAIVDPLSDIQTRAGNAGAPNKGSKKKIKSGKKEVSGGTNIDFLSRKNVRSEPKKKKRKEINP